MAEAVEQQPYRFDPVFEKAVVTLACSNARFYGRIGHALDPELFKFESSKLALRAAHTIFKESGRGPSASILVIQRLRSWMQDGKVKIEQVKLVAELFDDAEDTGLPDPDGVINELRPVLQQRIRDEAVQAGIESFGKKGDLSKVVSLEAKAQRVGVVDTSVGTILGPDSWQAVARMREIERLPTGVTELDSMLDGGLQRGGLGMWVGGPGDGKSMALTHTCGFNVAQGAFCVYATLELPTEEVLARIKACMTGIPINALKAGDTKAAEAVFAAMASRMGRLIVQDFTPLATTFEDVEEWIDRCEQHAGRKVDAAFIDYGDKLGARKTGKSKEDESGYSHGRIVFERMRIWAFESKRFAWTASQGVRRKDRKKRLDVDDTADSMHKPRVADLVVTLNVQDGDGEPSIELFCAKHRTGKSRFKVGPYPCAYEVGQIVPI